MSTVSDAISKLVKEDIAPGIDDGLVELSPVFKNIQNTSMGVQRDGLGRDWKFIKTLVTSLAGRVKASGTVGGDGIVGTDTPYTVHSTPGAFPGVNGFITPGFVQKVFTLQELQGNIFIPHEWLRADELTASLASAVAMTLQQTARKIALVKADLFFTPDATKKSLCTVGTITGNNDGTLKSAGDATTATCVVFTAGATSRIRNILPGLEVDIYSADGNTKRNDKDLIVYSVDPTNNEIRVDSADGTNPFSGQVAATDVLVLRDSKGNGPAGPESWIANSGTLYTNLDLAKYPQLKSQITAVNGSLTDDVLRKQLTSFIAGHGASVAPDTLLTTEGVLNEYVDQYDGDRRWAVQGTAQKIVGGYDDGVTFVLNGRVYKFMVGEQVPGQTLYGLKLRDKNIKRYLPPKLPGSSSRTEFDNIEFVAPLGGSKGIWKHAHSTDGTTTKYVEAPFVCIEEIVPDVIPALKLTGLTEDLAF